MQINYGLILVSFDENYMRVHHFVGFEDKPTQSDIDGLWKELNEDEEFGFCGKLNNVDYDIIEATPEIVQDYRKILMGD
jgi:hypothetical protein